MNKVLTEKEFEKEVAEHKSMKQKTKHEVEKELAQLLGFGSRTTLKRAQYIWKWDDKEIFEKIDSGELSINKAYNILKEREKEMKVMIEELYGAPKLEAPVKVVEIPDDLKCMIDEAQTFLQYKLSPITYHTSFKDIKHNKVVKDDLLATVKLIKRWCSDVEKKLK